MREPIELDAVTILETLNRHAVDYVVIGGFAAVLHGLARATVDLDITPSTDRDNLARLADALVELDAGLMAPGTDDPIAWPWSADAFGQFTTLTTRTRAGDLDICLRPDAPGGRQFNYDVLARNALLIELPPEVPVAALEDVIASKEASNRPKDQDALRDLRDLLAAIRSRRERPREE